MAAKVNLDYLLSNDTAFNDFIFNTALSLLPSCQVAIIFKKNQNYSSLGQYAFKNENYLICQNIDNENKFVVYSKEQSVAFAISGAVICSVLYEIDSENCIYLCVIGKEEIQNISPEIIAITQMYTQHVRFIINNLNSSDDPKIFTNQLYLAICLNLVKEIVRHRIKSEKYNSQLKEYINVSGLINSSLHLDDVLEAVMFSAKAVFNTESCSLLLLDDSGEYLYFHTIAGEKKEEIAKIKVPVGQGIAGLIAKNRKPMIINDALNDPRVYRKVDNESNFITKNILGAPLIADDKVIGVIEAINTIDRNHFDDSDIELFVSFSDAVALAIQKTALLDSLKKANANLQKKILETESLFDLGQAVVESGNVEELFLTSVNIIAELLECNRVAIIIVDDNREMINITALLDSFIAKFQDTFFKDSIIVDSILNGKVILNEGLDNNHDDELDKTLLFNSYIIIPLIQMEKKPIGVLCISDNPDGKVYTENEVRLLKTISAQVIKGYETFRLYENTIAKREMEKELEVTRQIQNNILPDKVNFNSNFDLGFLFKPAKEVSGDFYDFFQFENGVFSTMVADVSGKSLPAAIFMAMSSSTIRSFSRRSDHRPYRILEMANDLIYEDSHSGMFVTTFFLQYHPATMMIDFASAGHNEQFLIKKDGSIHIMKTKGIPLGVIQGSKYLGSKLKVEPGDIIVLYTDGVVEEKDLDDREFGLGRLIDLIKFRRDFTAQEICNYIYQKVNEFKGKSEQFDDFTIIIVKFNNGYQFKKSFLASANNIPVFREYIFQILKSIDCDNSIIHDVLLACDEAATNIVMHAYQGSNIKNPKFDVSAKILDNKIIIELADNGIEFTREKVKPPSLKANLKGEKKGGFGVFLIEKLMDKVEYNYENNINRMRMEKQLKP